MKANIRIRFNLPVIDQLWKSGVISIIALVLVLAGCKRSGGIESIENAILNDETSYFYTDLKQYPSDRASLPIGVFDSGTGGLSVLNDIVEYEFSGNSDLLRVFEKESFIYLADMANMPYGSYAMENNTELLQEHIIKNVQFLIDRKYYQSAGYDEFMRDKDPVKAIVIACNTATAYGQDIITRFLANAGLDIILIGVIDAAATGVINSFSPDENGSIAVLATDGTVRSGAYVSSIEEKKIELERLGDIQIFQQAGIGIAEAIDESKDFIDRSAIMTREDYMGPSEKGEGDMHIDLSIRHRYPFTAEDGALLYDGDPDNPHNIQINSVDNYVAYHLVSLMEKIRKTEGVQPLKAIVLGCTHYPFVEDTFNDYLDSLWNYKENGEYIYRQFMADEILMVNPAVKVAGQLHVLLDQQEILGNNNYLDSEFYISVPNLTNSQVEIREDGSFTYEYKYGRTAGNIQEYVKRVPFSRDAIPDDILHRLFQQVPSVFEMIFFFNQNNPKTQFLPVQKKINHVKQIH